MTDEKPQGCVAKAAGPIGTQPKVATPQSGHPEGAKEEKMSVMVGKPAPDFEAAAYHAGGFKNVRLSEFKGKWVFLCFYPGDFTFV